MKVTPKRQARHADVRSTTHEAGEQTTDQPVHLGTRLGTRAPDHKGPARGTKYTMKPPLLWPTDESEDAVTPKLEPRHLSTDESEDAAVREVHIMETLHDPHIVSLHAHWETESDAYIVMDLMTDGDLMDMMTTRGRELTEGQSKLIFRQLVSAVSYLHARNVVHRDIKLENILLDNGEVKLTDFGLATVCRPGLHMSTHCGTMLYWAPELFEAEAAYSRAVDIWALGVVLYTMLCGEPPFDPRLPAPLEQQIRLGVYNIPSDLRRTLDPHALALINGMLTVPPEARLTIRQVSRHRWLR